MRQYICLGKAEQEQLPSEVEGRMLRALQSKLTDTNLSDQL